MKTLFSSFTICILLLTSCGKKTPDHIGLVPKSSSMVVSLNSKQLIEDNFFELIKNVNVFEEQAFDNPSDIGIEVLSDYYVFLDGTDLMQTKVGGVFP